MADASPLPAPLWRRLVAAVYDGLLLAAIWLVVTMADTAVRILAGLPPSVRTLQACLLLAGLLFFAASWTHGGQTPGMRAWRLQLRRADGRAISWLVAAARYGFAWLAWLPLGAGVLWCAIDPRRRSWHDIWSGTEVVLLPKPLAPEGAPTPAPPPSSAPRDAP